MNLLIYVSSVIKHTYFGDCSRAGVTTIFLLLIILLFFWIQNLLHKGKPSNFLRESDYFYDRRIIRFFVFSLFPKRKYKIIISINFFS